MGNFRKFKVVPDLPEKLKPLLEIAGNLWLTWNPEAIKLFITLDGDLWERSQHNPMRMLGEISQEKLEELTHDEGFLSEVQRVGEQLDQYLHLVRGINHAQQVSIAYFSAEYGLSDTLPIYSGGLGILSGDHIKAASDLNFHFHGVGLLYQLGYFQQYLNMDGWQQDFYQVNDFHNMQVQEVMRPDGTPLEVELDFPGRRVFLRVWRILVGRVTIYMLDSNHEKNSDHDRRLTAQLYGGNPEMRLQQEIILGIGGVKMLDALGIQVTAVHMNEGHSAFTPFERARVLMKDKGLSFAEALETVRQSSIFTTHTNVQAAFDVFSPEMIRAYFAPFLRELGISHSEFMAYGRVHPDNQHESFSMTVAAVKNSAFVNGVSALHAEVSRDLLKNLWPAVPPEHVPIQPLTNGIHIPSWVSFEMNDLFERYLGSKWRERQDYRDAWEKVQNIPDPELWSVHEIRRRRLIAFTRQRLHRQLLAKGASNLLISESQEALNPTALTIGFARRFATYKRAYLIFKDRERLLKILNNPERPVQLVFAGKAHPQDQAGKELIKNIIAFMSNEHLRSKIAFIEDYDINVARYLVSGVDIWLNTPQRPLEACGTSGMKAACNGVLNFSVLDGWWDEAYDLKNGWAIGNRESYTDKEYQDEVESKAIYSILEKDIIPLFYERGSDGLPREWIRMMKHSLVTIASRFNTSRMVKEYFSRFYLPASENFARLSADAFAPARELVGWKNRMRADFPQVRIEEVRADTGRTYKSGERFQVQADLFLGKVPPEEIRVDAYFGTMVGEDVLQNSALARLGDVETSGEGRFRFSGFIPCGRTGSFGFKLRVTPFHPLLLDPYEMGLVLWG
ncbi:MAG: alpha-glucan family phosphorylase [Acidobacteria bacterium]|jgi:starch phosphorylase|nr:alpha-glucan family phosphorylase [Acidobacteriota bacterium]